MIISRASVRKDAVEQSCEPPGNRSAAKRDTKTDCRQCIKGRFGRNTCKIYGKMPACFAFQEIPAGWKPEAPRETSGAEKSPVAPRRGRKINRIQSRKPRVPYENASCPVCGRTAAQMRYGVHCPARRALVCMAHCYAGCAYLDDHTGHCFYTAKEKRNKAACI